MADSDRPKQAHVLGEVVQAVADVDDLTTQRAVAKSRMVAAITRAKCRGASFDEIARAIIRRGTGRAATVAERKREAGRVRQLLRRDRVTHGHADLHGGRGDIGLVPIRCDRHKGESVPDQDRLIKRTITTTTEEFEPAADLGEFFDTDPPEPAPVASPAPPPGASSPATSPETPPSAPAPEAE